ncbi:NupC/NupG family nucleoside CNT transporter [Pleionea sediminis]|uniref:NupC/NupG family nucleoside CNT transporter n=1 Tax=Pleionea sediminis TaxID=2569479 RepID=UPI00197C4506
MIRGLLAISTVFLVGYLLSGNRKGINWRTVGGALGLQLAIGAFALYVPFGKDLLLSFSNAVNSLLEYANDGISFMFGKAADKTNMGFIFAFHVLPVIIFFSSLIAVLYHLRIMEFVIRILGGGLRKVLRTSRPESLCATANIFVGQTEAPLVVRPFVAKMTRSELFAVMVCGMGSIAGSILAGYVGIGIELKYLIAASFMSAPGGLLMAKLVMPETEEPKNDIEDLGKEAIPKKVNVIDAAAEGAINGAQLAVNVGAMLIAFVALIALINGTLGYVGSLFGVDGLTLQTILGYLFQPIAWAMGVSWDEAHIAGSFLGQKMIINEFVAYLDFVNYQDSLSEHTKVIITFALCGFANLSSIAILLGGVGSMAPNRRGELASMGVKALLAATLANLMSASIAGLFISIS